MNKTRITELTPTQHDRMSSWAQEWIDKGWRTSPLTEEEWAVVESGARRCYEYAGIPFPKTVIRVSSPLVGAFAAPVAAYLIELHKKQQGKRGAVGGAVHGAVRVAVRDAVDDAVGDAVGDAVRVAVDGAVRDAVGGAVRGAVDGAVGGAVGDAVDGAVGGAVGGAVRGAVDGAVGGAVDDAVGGAVHGAVRGAVDDAVGDAVGGAVGDAVGDAVRGAVRGAVGDAVRDAVGDAVGGAVGGAVRVAVGDAVGDAVDGAVHGAFETLDNLRWFGWTLRHWAAWRGAYCSFFRDVCDLHLDGDLWDRSKAWDDLAQAGWWWPFRDFVMISDLPTTMHLEQVAPTGWGSHRLHAEDGPAISYGDGWGLHFWHGTKVDAWVVDGTATVERILKEPNAEVRRCAIEAFGWDRFITEAKLAQVGESIPDPGNPGNELSLWDVPERIYDTPIRVLLCTNGTVERDGTRRRFGLTVPASINSPLAAAAWGYGLTADQYATAEVRR